MSKKQIKLSKIFSFFVALGIFCDIIKKKYATDCNKKLGGFAYKTILTTILLSVPDGGTTPSNFIGVEFSSKFPLFVVPVVFGVPVGVFNIAASRIGVCVDVPLQSLRMSHLYRRS